MRVSNRKQTCLHAGVVKRNTIGSPPSNDWYSNDVLNDRDAVHALDLHCITAETNSGWNLPGGEPVRLIRG
eukprot:1136681-Pelagomonas_calceolata.AAC.2